MCNPLVSILVLSYNNTEHLNNCLESVFHQDYGNIELIVSNDGSDNFDEAGVLDFINQNRTNQFVSIKINKNERNLGTVKHLNKLLDMATGEYIVNIACDDEFSSATAISDMMNGFKCAPKDTMSIVAQTAMCNEDMSEVLELYVKPEVQEAINKMDPVEFYYRYLITAAVFPAASRILKKEAFDKYGKYDEQYFLIEDWTISLQQNKRGMRSYYIDVICVNHREGGVSHSEINPNSFSQKMYFLDEIKGYENILKDTKLTRNQKKILKDKYSWIVEKYEDIFIEKPRVSVLVLSYKNIGYLNNCLESVFRQNYNNIELIVSNDGDENFNSDGVSDFIEENCSENIKKVIVNKNERNLGTVKHLNKLLDMAAGEYIINIACDDEFSSPTAISDMMKGFKCAPKETMSIVAQTAMCNEDMSEILEFYVKPEVQNAINKLDPVDFYYKYLITASVFPAASRIFKKEAFNKYGKFDEQYFLIEDWTIALQQNKQGMRSYYIDVVCVNHREGGVSHSEINPNSFAQKMYFLDEIKGYENILQDSKLPRAQKKELKVKYEWLLSRYSNVFILPGLSIEKRVLFLFKNMFKMLPRIILKAKPKFLLAFVSIPFVKIQFYLGFIYLFALLGVFNISEKQVYIVYSIQVAFMINIILTILKYLLIFIWKLNALRRQFLKKASIIKFV